LKTKVNDKIKESPYKDDGLETPKKKNTSSRPGSAINNKTANKCKYISSIQYLQQLLSPKWKTSLRTSSLEK